MKTVRFWHYYLGDVRITLRKGQTLHHTSGGPCEEGWHRESHKWTFDGHVVINEWSEQSRDCDGRLDREGVSWFPANEAATGYQSPEGVAYPNWHKGREWQRDYAAEAEGY
jgi:hypothetical protein